MLFQQFKENSWQDFSVLSSYALDAGQIFTILLLLCSSVSHLYDVLEQPLPHVLQLDILVMLHTNNYRVDTQWHTCPLVHLVLNSNLGNKQTNKQKTTITLMVSRFDVTVKVEGLWTFHKVICIEIVLYFCCMLYG